MFFWQQIGNKWHHPGPILRPCLYRRKAEVAFLLPSLRLVAIDAAMLRVLLALAVTARAVDEGAPDPLNVDRTLLASAEYLAQFATAQDTTSLGLTWLCDPAKIATLEGDRAANPRVRRIAYWLEVARQNNRDPNAEIGLTRGRWTCPESETRQ